MRLFAGLRKKEQQWLHDLRIKHVLVQRFFELRTLPTVFYELTGIGEHFTMPVPTE